MAKAANINETSGGSVTQALPDPIKLLKDRMAVYEAAPEPCKGSLGLFLRKLHADITEGRT